MPLVARIEQADKERMTVYSVWFFRYLGTPGIFISSVESYSLATRIAANLIDEGFVDDAWVMED